MKSFITCVLATVCVALLGGVTPAHAAIVKVKLSSIVPGSENVTLVTNGDFEDISSGNTHTPTGWSRFGNMFYDGHAGVTVPANTGNNSARFHVDGGGDGNYQQPVALVPNTEYVLSGYLWHLGDSTHGGSTQLDLSDDWGIEPDDGGGSISISQSNPDANEGYFVSGTFNSGPNNTARVRPFFATGGEPTSGWPNQPTAAMWDNIAVTLASEYVAPRAIPEPATLGLALLSLVGCCTRRIM